MDTQDTEKRMIYATSDRNKNRVYRWWIFSASKAVIHTEGVSVECRGLRIEVRGVAFEFGFMFRAR